MIKKTITFEDLFTEESVTKEYYFHLFEDELALITAKTDLEAMLMKTVKEKDYVKMYVILKELILMAYGEKNERGAFVKKVNGVPLREEFEASPAFDALMASLNEDLDAAKEFIVGIMPSPLKKKLSDDEIKRIMDNPEKVLEEKNK